MDGEVDTAAAAAILVDDVTDDVAITSGIDEGQVEIGTILIGETKG